MTTNKVALEDVPLFIILQSSLVSHNILLEKLKNSGIKDITLDWFTSYLADRRQYTEIGGQKSDSRHIDISVLQGSILGPILFLCFINNEIQL